MKRDYFIALEHHCNSQLELQEVLDQLAFDENGLIPIIAQDASISGHSDVCLDE